MKKLLIVLGILVLVPAMALAQGSYYVDYYSNNFGFAVTITTVTAGSNQVVVTSTTGLAVGMTVTGAGIPAGTTVVNISGNQIFLSANAIVSGTNIPLTFSAPGSPSQIIRIVNVGTLGTPLTSPVGDICANIYVFDANQEMLACCAARLTPNELASANVSTQLTSNTVTTISPASGVIKIVLAQPPGSSCNPTTIGATPDAGLGVVFGTHLQREGGAFWVTETEKQAAALSSA